MTKTEMSFQQKSRMEDIISMIRSGTVTNQEMISYLTKDGLFTEQEAVYAIGYLKDRQEEFIR